MQGHRSRRVEERGKKLLRYEAELSIAGAQGLEERGLEERRGELFRDLMQAEQRIDELRKRSMALDLLLKPPCDQQCLGSSWV